METTVESNDSIQYLQQSLIYADSLTSSSTSVNAEVEDTIISTPNMSWLANLWTDTKFILILAIIFIAIYVIPATGESVSSNIKKKLGGDL